MIFSSLTVKFSATHSIAWTGRVQRIPYQVYTEEMIWSRKIISGSWLIWRQDLDPVSSGPTVLILHPDNPFPVLSGIRGRVITG